MEFDKPDADVVDRYWIRPTENLVRACPGSHVDDLAAAPGLFGLTDEENAALASGDPTLDKNHLYGAAFVRGFVRVSYNRDTATLRVDHPNGKIAWRAARLAMASHPAPLCVWLNESYPSGVALQGAAMRAFLGRGILPMRRRRQPPSRRTM